MRTRKRWSIIGALLALIGSFAITVGTAPLASADTTQSNGCLGVTGTFSTFDVPITGAAAANPGTVNPGSATIGSDTITLSGVSVTVAVDSTLIGAGITTGLVSAAPDLAHIGVSKINNPPDGTTIADVNGGISAAAAAAGQVKLQITGTNVSPAIQTATNPASAGTTFYVTANAADGTNVVVYSSVSNPAGGLDNSRTGVPLVGSLNITIPLGDTVWTPTGGGTAHFQEENVAPSNLTVPTAADLTNIPLVINAKINGAVSVPFKCWPGTVNTGVTPSPLVPGASSDIASIGVVAPPTAPVCASPQATSVGGGQSVSVSSNCTDINNNFTASNTSITLTDNLGAAAANGTAAHGTVTVNANGSMTYANDGLGATTDKFFYTATDASSLTSNVVEVDVAVLNNQCTVPGGVVGGAGAPGPSSLGSLTAAGTDCQLRQVLILPVVPSSLSMSEAAAYGNPTFSQAVLGGHLVGTTCTPGFVTLDGQPQTACGALNPITVINARGTDAKWDLTGQITDFLDGTRGPTNTCSPPTANNIAQSPPNNHCIPGDNLGWIPLAQITDPAVPGDTAAIAAGGIILPPPSTAQTPPAFPPSPLTVRQNTNNVTAPFSILNLSTPGPGLHDLAQELCGSPTNQSGGTFQCDAGLVLAVPGSAAAGTYTATLTLTLA